MAGETLLLLDSGGQHKHMVGGGSMALTSRSDDFGHELS